MPETTTDALLSDQQIIDGFRDRDPQITRDYFYGACRIAYHIYNKRYNLQNKPGLDFFSLAHEYYIALDKHDFHQLEDRRPNISLKTWMINGFRFVLLDRFKAFKKESSMQSFEERLEKVKVGFDVPDDNFAEDFRDTVMEICTDVVDDSRSSRILQMILIDGFKGKEVGTRLGITPSAVTQRYHKLMENVVIPYFKQWYSVPNTFYGSAVKGEVEEGALGDMSSYSTAPVAYELEIKLPRKMEIYSRITPGFIRELKPNEIFVFGSNLAGMHGGGAARTAVERFGAVMGNGDGPQGQSYAIPTMQGGPETIKPYVDKFIAYASSHPELTFLVTPIGCGIAGFSVDDIAPLFSKAVEVKNIWLPKKFWNFLQGY